MQFFIDFMTSFVDIIYNELMWHFLHFILGNYLRFLGVIFMHVLAETTTGRCSLKEADPKF